VLVVSLATLLIVLVARRGAPEVTLLTPAPGSLARVDDQVYIQAEATDQRGVTRMELWVDDILIGVSQATSSQGDRTLQARQAWTFTYTGTHSIMAVAYNAAGRASQTDRATVEVVPFLISQPTPTPSLTPLPPASPPTFSAPTHAPTPTRVQPTAAPTQPPATATATAPPTATPSGDLEPVIQFWVSPRAIQAGEQATLSWRIENVSAAYLDGEPVSGPFGQKQVSPTTTTLYTLRVLLAGGEEVVQLVTLVVLP
jgi:hypothetical protein